MKKKWEKKICWCRTVSGLLPKIYCGKKKIRIARKGSVLQVGEVVWAIKGIAIQFTKLYCSRRANTVEECCNTNIVLQAVGWRDYIAMHNIVLQ